MTTRRAARFALTMGALAAATTIAMTAASAQAGDPAKGKAVFAKCMICHAVQPGVNKLGPSLANVIGRKAGSVAGYTYSAAMKGSGITWTQTTLDKYLVNPRAMVPGTKMIFAGLPTAADRANLIAYLGNPAAVK